MKRRKFLLMTGVGTGLLILPPALYLASPSVRKYAAGLIFKELNYLKLNEEGVHQYVADYFGASSSNMMTNLYWKAFYYLGLSPDSSNQVFEMVKYYLLSSDFFINKTDESKIVNYLGFYSPYRSPIPNPYSFVLYPPSQEHS